MNYLSLKEFDVGRLYNGKQYADIDDQTVVENKSTGLFECTFRTKEAGCLFSAGAGNSKWSDIRLGISGALRFFYIDGSAQLSFHVNTLALDYLLDNKEHAISIKVDGIDNLMIIDGTTYNGSDLTFSKGSKTSTFFMHNNLDSAAVAVQKVNTGSDLLVNYFKGTVLDLKVKDTDFSTNLYAMTNGIRRNLTTSTPIIII